MKRLAIAIIVRLVYTRFIASPVAECVDRRHQRAPGHRTACPAPGDGEREGVGRFGRSDLPPSPHECRQRVLRDVLGGSATAGSGQHIPDQPGCERGRDRLEIHSVNEPAARVS